MWYKKTFDLTSKYDNPNGLLSAINIISESVNKYDRFDDLEEMSFDDLDNIIYRAEKIALSCRCSMEKKEKTSDKIEEKYSDLFIKNNPISISFDGKTLRIFTPFTFKRMYRDDSLKENYLLMNYVKASLIHYQNENKINLFRAINSPLILIIKRKSTQWNRLKICDNDNLENGRIVNEILNGIGYSDNALIMNVYSCFQLVSSEDECGMEFVVFAKSDISNHLEEF